MDVISNTYAFNKSKQLFGNSAIGVIDGDFHLEKAKEKWKSDSIFCIPVQEVENLLCDEVLLEAGNTRFCCPEECAVEKAKALSERLDGETGYGSIYDQSVIDSADILINTTPVGMSPNIRESPVEAARLHSGLLVYDIVYNPLKTRLLREAETAGARTLGGLWMLVYQGVEAFKIWTGIDPSSQTMYDAALAALEANRH